MVDWPCYAHGEYRRRYTPTLGLHDSGSSVFGVFEDDMGSGDIPRHCFLRTLSLLVNAGLKEP
jgi:hypothetical protein